MKTVFIYELIDPKTNETRYVGKSVDPQGRLNKGHLGDNKTSHKRNWIKSLKEEN